MQNVNEDLKKREPIYGPFHTQASTSQILKAGLHSHKNYKTMDAPYREALEMIQHKIGRILNGDPNYADNWRDIAGYATLAEQYTRDREGVLTKACDEMFDDAAKIWDKKHIITSADKGQWPYRHFDQEV